MSGYICYVLSNGTRTYVGITNKIERRLRQHNGEIKGGARATANRGPWFLKAQITNFKNKGQALSFEWFMHHMRPRYKYIGSVEKRLKCAEAILLRFPQKFTHLNIRSAIASSRFEVVTQNALGTTY